MALYDKKYYTLGLLYVCEHAIMDTQHNKGDAMQITLDIYNSNTAFALATATVLITALLLWAKRKK